MKKVWAEENETISREKKFYIRGTEVEPLEDDLIAGYMLGATPVAYDELLNEDKLQYEPGLKFVGFPKRNSIPDEYFCGDSLYWIIHQKGRASSARKLDALVKALINTERVILCWKIFSKVHNNPKIVVLLPNELNPDQPASLTMIELAYHVQHQFWDFPPLTSQKSECSPEQLTAIDNLIDSMDLNISSKNASEPRKTYSKDLLPYDSLPHIHEQNIMDMLERKILHNCPDEDDEQFQEMLKDKNFVEVFWKLPEEIEKQAKEAAKEVKKLFPLEENTAYIEKFKKSATANSNIKEEPNQNLNSNNSVENNQLQKVGNINPAEDFEQLLKKDVLTIQNNTLRDVKFNDYAKQLRAAIWNLLFDSTGALQTEKILEAFKVYRKSCYDFNTLDQYNQWITEIKSNIQEQGMQKFWKENIVKYNLGFCIVGEPTLDDKIKMSDFYTISGSPVDDEMDDSSVDDLLANI